jgi:crossover junction endodeoxyribonuclease RusA
MIVLPFPPSVNRLWRQFKGRTILSAEGRKYRLLVMGHVDSQMNRSFDGPVGVVIHAYLPDARRRDLDNLLKASLDALTHAKVWEDDSQIRRLTIEHRGIDRDNPRLEVGVSVWHQTGVTCA